MNFDLRNELEDAIREKKADEKMTLKKKKEFIEEIKSGLGEAIKQNPRNIKILKKPWHRKAMDWIKKFFTSF
jgi:hypothetical protein